MLYIDGVRQTKFDKEYKKLAQIFPYSFTEKGGIPNGQPIKIELTKPVPKVRVFKRGNTTESVGMGRMKIMPQKISASGVFTNADNASIPWNYTTKAPKMVGGEKVFDKAYISLNVPHIFDPVKDAEKIIALFFYSPLFSNGEVARVTGKGKNARFKFVMPKEKAANMMKTISVQTKYSNMLIVEENRISDEQLGNICNLLSITTESNLDETRLKLYDKLVKDESFRERFDRISEMIISESKKSVDSVNFKSLIKKLQDRKLLGINEGEWVTKNNSGVITRTIAKVIGDTKADKEMNLVEYLNSASVDAEFLLELSKD